MRRLEYIDIPGVTINRRLFAFQKLSTSSKKIKTDHNYVGCSQDVRHGMITVISSYVFLLSFKVTAEVCCLKKPLLLFKTWPPVRKSNLLLRLSRLILMVSRPSFVIQTSVCSSCTINAFLLSICCLLQSVRPIGLRSRHFSYISSVSTR